MSKRKPLMHHWLNSAKSNLFKEAAVDAQGTKLNNLKFIAAVLMFVKTLKAALGNEKNVGVLLPSSSIGAIINMTLMVMGKVPVNLNYTLSPEVMEKALKKPIFRKSLPLKNSWIN